MFFLTLGGVSGLFILRVVCVWLQCVESARGSVLCDEVGKGLYKLVFQLLLLLETNSKMILAIYNSAIAKNVSIFYVLLEYISRTA